MDIKSFAILTFLMNTDHDLVIYFDLSNEVINCSYMISLLFLLMYFKLQLRDNSTYFVIYQFISPKQSQ